MNERISLLAISCALVLLVAPHANAAEPVVTVRDVDATDFPAVEMTVSVDGKDVSPEELTVLEDRTPVEDALVEPLVETAEGIDIVLVIDTSGSMKGQPLASATAAALRFVTSLPQDIRVGVMTFADRPKVLASISADHSFALNALGKLSASGETALYDAAVASSGMFQDGPGQRNVILLSDGADTASKLDLRSAVAKAKKDQISFFTVGLTSGEFDEKALKTLASSTGGSYSPAATADLSSLYEGLARELSNQFQISYESAKTEGGQTTVSVSAGGNVDASLFVAPEVDAPAAPEPKTVAAPDPLVAGEMWMLTALGLCFLATFLFVLMFVGAKARARRDRDLIRRTGATQQAALAPNDPDRATSAWVPSPILAATERVTHAAGATASIDAKLERAGVSMRAGEFVVALVGTAFAGGLIGTVVVGNLIFGVLMAGVAAAVPFLALGIAAKRRTGKLHGQLPDILMILAGSLRAGHSFLEALDMVAQEVGEPGAGEFGRVVAEIRLGRSVPDAMDAMALRIGSDDFKWALLAVNIQREVGGNLAEVLDTVSDTMRDREGIRRQIQVLTAEGRLSVAILAGLPVGVALYLSWVNPEYLSLLFNNGLGLLMTGVSVLMLSLGVIWMRKVVKIDV